MLSVSVVAVPEGSDADGEAASDAVTVVGQQDRGARGARTRA
jgi:hypothetical protein